MLEWWHQTFPKPAPYALENFSSWVKISRSDFQLLKDDFTWSWKNTLKEAGIPVSNTIRAQFYHPFQSTIDSLPQSSKLLVCKFLRLTEKTYRAFNNWLWWRKILSSSYLPCTTGAFAFLWSPFEWWESDKPVRQQRHLLLWPVWNPRRQRIYCQRKPALAGRRK